MIVRVPLLLVLKLIQDLPTKGRMTCRLKYSINLLKSSKNEDVVEEVVEEAVVSRRGE